MYRFQTEGSTAAWGKSTDGGVTFEVVDASKIPENWFNDPKFKQVYDQQNKPQKLKDAQTEKLAREVLTNFYANANGIPKWALPYVTNFTGGAASLVSGLFKSVEGAAENLIGMTADEQREDGVNPVSEALDSFHDFTDAFDTKYYDEKGNALQVDQLLEKGDWPQALKLASEQAAESAPSMIASVYNPLIGGALMGVSTTGTTYKEDLENRPEEALNDVIGNAMWAGGSEFLTEWAGGKFFRSLNGLKKSGAADDVIRDYTKNYVTRFVGRTLGSGVGESITESVNSLIQDAGEVLFYDDKKTQKELISNVINSAVPALLMGGFGGGISSVNRQEKSNVYKFVAPQKWKQEHLNLGKQIFEASNDLDKAEGSGVKANFRIKLKKLQKAKQKHEQALVDGFDNMSNKELIDYGKNIDAVNENLNIINNNKYSQSAQEDAEQKNIELIQDNLNSLGQEYTGKDIETEKIIGEALKASEIIEESLKKVKGINREDLEIKVLKSDKDIDALSGVNKDGIKNSDGAFIGKNKDGKATIYINKNVAAMAGATNVLGHELLHYMISRKFKTDNKSMAPLIDELKTYLKDNHSDVFGRVQQRINKFYTNEDGTIKDDALEEYLNVFSDLISKQKIDIKEVNSKGLAGGLKDVMSGFGFGEIKLDSAKDVISFLSTYNKNINRKGLLGKLMGTKILDVGLTSKKLTKEDGGVQAQKSSKTITDAVDKLGKVDKDGNNLEEKGTGNFYYQAEADNVVKEIKEKGYLDNLIAAKYKTDKVPKNFVSDVITALTPDIKSFKPEENNSLFGYLQGRITFRAGDVYNKIYKQKEENKGSRQAGETTKEGEVKIQVAAETTSEMKQLEEKDMSIQAQIQEKADKQKVKKQKESKFRKALGIETGGVLYIKVLDAARKSLLRAYSTKDTVRQIQRNLRDQANKYLFKYIKNFLGTNKYEANLKQYRENIMESLFVADLVQMERETPEANRVFTKFVKKLTTKQEVEDAVDQNLLPPSAINAYNKDKSVNLYKKSNPTEKQFLSYFMIPAINPVTGLRSGKKGTRKDTLAKNMAGALSYDATMEVAQETEVAEKREQLSEVRGEDISSLERLAEAINRDIDVKFSKSINPSKVPKISQYLKYQENKLGIYHPGFEFIYIIRQSVEEGLDLKTAYDNAKAALPSQSPILDLIINDGNLNNLHIDNIVYGVNNFVLGKIRKLGHDSSVKYLKNKLKKATTDKQKVAIVNEYLKNIGRSVRSSMVDGITTNKKLYEEVIVPLGLGEFYELANAKPRGKKLMFRESTEIKKYKPVVLYENIEAIKNDPDSKRSKVNDQAKEARKYIKEILDSKLDNVEKKAIVQLMAYDQRGALRKSSKLGMNTVGLQSSETIMEHEFTVKDLVDKLNNYIDGKDIDLEGLFNKGKVHVLPKKLDQILREEKISQKGDNRYENQRFKQKLNEYISDGVVVNAKFSKSQDFTKINKAISFSRSTNNSTKGITVLDFDDTLATTKSLVKFTRPDGTTGTLNAEQYASTYENLLDQGYTFDFSEFNKVVKGKLAPLFQKALKLQSKFGPKNMFVLTARPPAAQKAIFDFLKANGLNIPINNITGLGNSTAESKALWVADKVGEGYNDFYFADDALQNVKAVKNMLDQFDVKSKVQQAKLKFSKSMNEKFNDILQEVTGIESQKRFAAIKGRKRGEGKGKFRFFIPPSHEDFVGLLYNFLGKGKEGNAHRDFFEQALVRPLNRANREYDTARQSIANDFKALNKRFPDVKSKLPTKTPDGDFTYQDAVRIYLWNKHGYDIPGLSEIDLANLVEIVMSDTELQAYAENINVISKQETYVKPTDGWNSGDLRVDLDDATGRVGREQYFTEFLENVGIVFSEENLNKIEAGYGKGVRSALEDILYRIKTGKNRPTGQNEQVNKLMNYLNGSVGTVMFFNMRSALLQQMSIVNYINFADNNIFAVAKTFANQEQYWADWSFIFNSDMLKQRRGGIQTDVNGAELAASLRNSKDITRKLISKLLELGFLPTQIGDNVAIATGGASYYRNRINTYLKQGLSKKEAEARAFTDFQDITQSTQQSARPDMVSQQQASVIGKVILNFQNVTSQFNRLGKKAFQDIYNRRITKPNTTQMQSDISNASRITYYFAVQNAIFYTLQTALFAMMFDDDEEDNNKLFLKKKERLINGSIDSVLRGSGLIGGVIATLKNVAIAFARQRDVKYNPDESAVALEALNLSPVLGIKIRKIVNAEKTLNYNKKVIKEMETFDIDNPQWSAVTSYTESLTNIPLNRLYNKTQNVRQALNNEHSAWERSLMFLGWSQYNLNLKNKKMEEIKAKTKKKKRNTGRKTITRKTIRR